jgi:S-adenosylmethionine hydrolase
VTRVTFLTDFGTADGYAAAMAGVVAAGAPDALVDHASHDVAHGDVRGAAIALSRYASIYPQGTVHVVVVDPGVGTHRRAIAARIDGRYYVAPDNGVLSLVLQGADRVRVVEVTDPAIVDEASATFHGRDIFAPTAAFLARGGELESLGAEVHDPHLLPMPQPGRTADGAEGEILEVDRFGNLVTNIPADWLPEGARVAVEGTAIGPVRRTYGDVSSGEILALVGSVALLEVSVRDGSAADRLGVGRGAEVLVTREG